MLRMIILWLVVLPLVHWIVVVYARSSAVRGAGAGIDDGGEAGTREDYIALGPAGL